MRYLWILLILCVGCCPDLSPKVDELESQLQERDAQIQSLELEVSNCDLKIKEIQKLYDTEKLKGKCPELRNFYDYYELVKFVREDKTNEQKYIPKDFDCEEYALMLQENAFKKGFYVYLFSVQNDTHLMNGAIVGDMFYSIEPQSDEIKCISRID